MNCKEVGKDYAAIKEENWNLKGKFLFYSQY